MERGVFDILVDLPAGRELIWSSIEKERAAWALEREASAREREEKRAAWALEREASAREREASAREREALARALEREIEAWERERELLIERESAAAADLQKQLDFAAGLMTVRSVLEGIVTSAFPSKSATDALRLYCEQPRFQAYLAAVSASSGISVASLTKSAKGAYGMFSQTIHGGTTHLSSDDTAVPQAVLRDKSTLHAVAAIFKLERRDVRFYAGGPSGVLKLPSPPRSASHSAAASASNSPPKPADAIVGEAGAGSAGEGADTEAATAAAAAAGASGGGGGGGGGDGDGGGGGGSGGGGV